MASAQANSAQKQLYQGIPIYGMSSPSRETVLADKNSLDELTTTLIVNKLRLRAINATTTDVQDAVDEAKFAAAEHFVAQSAFPSAQLRNGIHNMQAPYFLPPPGFTIGLSTPHFDMGQFLYDLRQYSAFYGGRCVYDVAVLVKSQDPAQPIVLDIYQSQPGRQGSHTLWYIQQMCRIPGAGRDVEMLQALAPSTPPPAPAPAPAPAMPVLPPAPAAAAALPAPPPPAHRAIQPRKPHHYSAVPYAGLTADQILAQVHTEHMFGGVILVLYLTYGKGELMKKLSDRRQRREGMTAFGPRSQQVVHYRVKNAIEHIFGKANYKANAKALKDASNDRAQAAAWRTRLNDPATYAAATCCRSDDDDAAPSSGATLPAQNPAASGPVLQALTTNNGEASSTASRAYGSSQAQQTPAQPLMAPESRGQQSFGRSTLAPASDAVMPSSSPLLLDPALRDNTAPTSAAMPAPALSNDMASTSAAVPAPASQDANASDSSCPMEDVQNGAIVAPANEALPGNVERPVLGASETLFLQWANQQTGNEASATPMDVDEPQEPNNEALQSNDAAVSPQESQQPTQMEIENAPVSPGQSSQQAPEQIADTTMSPDDNQQQTQDQSDDTRVSPNENPQLIQEQVDDAAVSPGESLPETPAPIEGTAVSSDEIQQQTQEQIADTAVISDNSEQPTPEQSNGTADEDQQQTQEQLGDTAVSSGEQQQQDQDLNEDTAAPPADAQPQVQEQSEDADMASDEIQQQVQEQEHHDNALDDAQGVASAQPQEHSQDDQQQNGTPIPETEQPDEPHDLEPDWDYFWDRPGEVFCCGCNGAGRHFDDHEKDCFKLFDPEFP
ncbi:hypothetical protein CBER1_05030 [Cercospora berteroae]|uniref:Uncharacterized protein n=1 Tax=Cercospora berteroae TaxID=357750 RepID=A0A2S6BRF1_9PEZI|nr:hypothetical protein CBER1_05030 [Cercospora berteroae]